MGTEAGTEAVQGGAEEPTPLSTDGGTDDTAGETTTEQQPNKTPWDDYLTDLPESVRPLVEPKFREWDASVTQRFQSLQSEYEPYKPLFDDYDAEALAEAVSIAQAMENDPEGFISAVMQAYGLDQGTAGQQEAKPEGQQAQPQGEQQTGEVNPFEQKLTQHEELLRAMAETLVSERESRAEAEGEAELDALLANLHKEHGEFDENYVLTLMANDVDPAQAVQQFNTLVQTHAKRLNTPAAKVAGSGGGGYPSQQVDLASLDSKSTKNLIVEMLKAEGQQ